MFLSKTPSRGLQDVPKTPQDASKMPPRRLLFCMCFSMPFWIDFWSVLLPILVPKINQNRQKTIPRCTPISTPFVYRFLARFCSQLRSPKPHLALAGLFHFEKSPFGVDIDFGTNFDTKLTPFVLQKSSKARLKSIPGDIDFSLDFWIDFFTILAPFWEPSRSHVDHY